jgi:hypothetical protein
MTPASSSRRSQVLRLETRIAGARVGELRCAGRADFASEVRREVRVVRASNAACHGVPADASLDIISPAVGECSAGDQRRVQIRALDHDFMSLASRSHAAARCADTRSRSSLSSDSRREAEHSGARRRGRGRRPCGCAEPATRGRLLGRSSLGDAHGLASSKKVSASARDSFRYPRMRTLLANIDHALVSVPARRQRQPARWLAR